ncbi:MAG TPA: hypothetical protein DCL21_03130 [Alphaproteobacteria bacterium]|nr:hypothetical protein [Alphaproteobacteria bacterium]
MYNSKEVSQDVYNVISAILKMEIARFTLKNLCTMPVNRIFNLKNEYDNPRHILHEYINYLKEKSQQTKKTLSLPTIHSNQFISYTTQKGNLTLTADITTGKLEVSVNSSKHNLKLSSVRDSVILFLSEDKYAKRASFLAVPFIVCNFQKKVIPWITSKSPFLDIDVGSLSKSDKHLLMFSYAVFKQGQVIDISYDDSDYPRAFMKEVDDESDIYDSFQTVIWAMADFNDNKASRKSSRRFMIIGSDRPDIKYFVLRNTGNTNIKMCSPIAVTHDAPKYILEGLGESRYFIDCYKLGEYLNIGEAKEFYKEKRKEAKASCYA